MQWPSAAIGNTGVGGGVLRGRAAQNTPAPAKKGNCHSEAQRGISKSITASCDQKERIIRMSCPSSGAPALSEASIQIEYQLYIDVKLVRRGKRIDTLQNKKTPPRSIAGRGLNL